MDRLEQCVKDISNNYYEYLINLQNVNGVAYGYKYINNKNTFEPCLNILVENKVDKKFLTKNNIIPKAYMGISTDVIECGKIRVNNADDDYKVAFSAKMRPLTGGCAIRLGINDEKKEKKVIGSICCIVQKKNNKKGKNDYYLLSTNHTLAHYGKKPKGSLVIQPAEIIGEITQTANIVAMIETFIEIKEFPQKGTLKDLNVVDCGIAKLISNSLISDLVFAYYIEENNGVVEEVVNTTKIRGVGNASLGMYVKRYGAGSGRKEGKVKTLHGTFTVYSDDKKMIFIEQLGIEMKSEPGDSGAPVLSRKSNKIIGMHIGSDERGFSMCNNINIVMDKLNVKLYLAEY